MGRHFADTEIWNAIGGDKHAKGTKEFCDTGDVGPGALRRDIFSISPAEHSSYETSKYD